MFFKKKPKEGPRVGEAPPPPDRGAGPEAVLIDELGLYHLWYLELRLREELARAPRNGSVFSLAAWQLKLLPGENPSSDLLQRAADLIAGCLRSYDVLARIDEERFFAILNDANYESAATVAYRIKGDLQIRLRSPGRWQAGVATFQTDGVNGDALIQAVFRRLDEDARAA